MLPRELSHVVIADGQEGSALIPKITSFAVFFEKKVFSKNIFRLEFITAWMLICTSFPQCWP